MRTAGMADTLHKEAIETELRANLRDVQGMLARNQKDRFEDRSTTRAKGCPLTAGRRRGPKG